tara:strand:- start:878 stop:3367 length:2490 start_codon:yes stop_codon:yes gene_type:complete
MAYNTLSGTVEFAGANGSLENTVRTDDSIQTIDGRKTFLQRITASAITLNGTVLAPPVISSVTNAAATRVTYFDGASGVAGNTNFTFAAGSGLLSATLYSGSAAGLTNIRTDKFQGFISASNLVLGNGVKSDSGTLVVSGGAGITVTATGVKPNLDTYGGLNLNTTALMLDAGQTYDISNGGQSLATGDKLFVQDVAGASPAAPALRSMTVGTLSTYLQSNLTFSPITAYNNEANHRIIAGTATGGTVNGLAALTFDGSKLAVIGDVSGSGIVYTKKLTSSFGAVISNSVGVNTNAPAYEIHAKGNDASVFADGDNNAYFRLGIAGTSKGYLQVIGATSDMVLGNTTSNADVILGAKVGVAQTTMLRLDGGRGAMTASVPLSCSLSVSASYFYGDGSQLTNVDGGGISFNGSTANGLVTYANASTADVEANLRFSGTKLSLYNSLLEQFYVTGSGLLGTSSELFMSGNVVIRNTDPTINFSSSAGTSLGQIGMNSSDNILIQNDTINKHIVLKVNDNGTTREGFRLNGAVPEVVVNEGSDSLVDFRVEGDTNPHTLFVKGSTNRVGIGTGDPQAVAHITSDTNGGTVLAIQQSNDGTDAPNIDFKKSRGDFGSPAKVQPNDFLGHQTFQGYDGAAYASHADIYVQAGTPIGGSSHPGKIVIRTVPTNSTTLTTAVTIDENQKTTINGSLRAKQLHTTVHNFANTQADAFYIPFMSSVENTSPGYLQQYIAPANGRLIKAIVRTTNGQSGSIDLDVMVAGDGVTNFTTGPSSVAERVTTTMTARDTAYTFATSGSNHFVSVDLVGVRIDPQSSVGSVNMTCIWEYDLTTV